VSLERFWRCVACEAVIRLTETDGPAGPLPPYPLWGLVAREDQARFLEAHRSHLIELLVQTTPAVAASGPMWDPVTVLWWEVSNAARRFVIEGFREPPPGGAGNIGLDHPLSYRCKPGRLRAVATRVGIPNEVLASAFDAALFPHVLPHRKLEALTRAAALSLDGLGPERLEVISESPTDPTVATARMPEADLERLLSSVRSLLAPWEQQRVGAHIRKLHGNDELTLTIARHYEVELES
jgi:hypothetical protein